MSFLKLGEGLRAAAALREYRARVKLDGKRLMSNIDNSDNYVDGDAFGGTHTRREIIPGTKTPTQSGPRPAVFTIKDAPADPSKGHVAQTAYEVRIGGQLATDLATGNSINVVFIDQSDPKKLEVKFYADGDKEMGKTPHTLEVERTN